MSAAVTLVCIFSLSLLFDFFLIHLISYFISGNKQLMCTHVCTLSMCVSCAYSLVTELDQVHVCGSRRQAADVKVGFAELLQACAAAVAAAAGTGRSHGVGLHTGKPLLAKCMGAR